MKIATLERDVFGEPLTPATRFVVGVTTVLAIVGHILLGSVAVLLLYVLVTAAF